MPKHNPKEVVNIVTLVTEYINKLNAACKEAKMDKVFDIRIIDTMTNPSTEEIKRGVKSVKCKQLIHTVASIETGDRITLYTVDYAIHNPAKLLTSDYKRVLYRELLYNAIGSFGFSLENRKIQERISTTEENPNNFAMQPFTKEEAYKQ